MAKRRSFSDFLGHSSKAWQCLQLDSLPPSLSLPRATTSGTSAWQVNGTDLPAATSETYTIDPVAVNDTGDYQCVVINTSTNESVTSAAASLTVGKCVSA